MDLYYLQLLIGFIGLTAIAIPFSSNIKEINYRNIGVGILFQILLAFILIKIPIIVTFFKSLGDGVIALQNATQKVPLFYLGSYQVQDSFVQSDPSAQVQSAYFAFGILPFILVMSALTAWLWHIKVLKVIVDAFSKVCQKLFNIGGPIGLGVCCKCICRSG